MLTVEEVKSLINAELGPVKAKFAHYDQKIRELETSLSFLSGKYDTLINQVQSSNGKYNGLEKKVKDLQKVQFDLECFVDDLAQYLRRDCVEISGIPPTEELTCEDIVLSLGNEMGLELDKEDISTAHVQPTFDKVKDDKMIVKFTRRSVRNDFYGNRKEVAGSKVSSISSLATESDKKVYISESLTPSKKKLFGVVNKLRKKLQWKYIWSNNGRIYLKQAANSAKTYKFDSPVDLAKFEALMKQPPSDLTKKFHLTHKPS